MRYSLERNVEVKFYCVFLGIVLVFKLIYTYCTCILQDGFLSGIQVSYLQKRLWALFEEIRPNAVALVDAFDFSDMSLDSCLGRYDGQVYQALYDYAKSAPMNAEEVITVKVILPKPVSVTMHFEVV